jgi:hypothetical protein
MNVMNARANALPIYFRSIRTREGESIPAFLLVAVCAGVSCIEREGVGGGAGGAYKDVHIQHARRNKKKKLSLFDPIFVFFCMTKCMRLSACMCVGRYVFAKLCLCLLKLNQCTELLTCFSCACRHSADRQVNKPFTQSQSQIGDAKQN